MFWRLVWYSPERHRPSRSSPAWDLRDFREAIRLVPGPPVAALLSLAVIILYYIAFDISIGRINNIAFDILFIFYIAFNRFLRYNKATMGEGAQKNKLPPEGRNMTVSKAQQRAVSKYMKENYDVYQIRMPKGKKDDIKEAASAVGESMNQYIINAIDQRMERDSAAPAASEGPEKEDPQA